MEFINNPEFINYKDPCDLSLYLDFIVNPNRAYILMIIKGGGWVYKEYDK